MERAVVLSRQCPSPSRPFCSGMHTWGSVIKTRHSHGLRREYGEPYQRLCYLKVTWTCDPLRSEPRSGLSNIPRNLTDVNRCLSMFVNHFLTNPASTFT